MAVYNNNLKFAIVDTSNNNTDLLINQFAATIEGIATGVKPSLASNNPTGPGYLYGIQDMTSPWYWLALTGGSKLAQSRQSWLSSGQLSVAYLV